MSLFLCRKNYSKQIHLECKIIPSDARNSLIVLGQKQICHYCKPPPLMFIKNKNKIQKYIFLYAYACTYNQKPENIFLKKKKATRSTTVWHFEK